MEQKWESKQKINFCYLYLAFIHTSVIEVFVVIEEKFYNNSCLKSMKI